jgi:type II secretory pathway predicted ATPase ExeA
MSRYRRLGLIREPFAAEPDLAFMAPTLGQTDALLRIVEFVRGRGRIALVSGEPGIGKSMLRLASTRELALQPALRIMTLDRPSEWSTDVAFLRAAAFAFGGDAGGRTTLDLLTEIEAQLTRIAADDHWPLLLIDDAHRLTSSQLDLLRTISSLEPHGLSLILFAEPELEERIARRRSLDGRVALRHTLNPLNTNDALALLRHRLEAAGQADGEELVDRAAADDLARYAAGIPGALIALAADAVDLAARRNVSTIDREIVTLAARRQPPDERAARQIGLALEDGEERSSR